MSGDGGSGPDGSVARAAAAMWAADAASRAAGIRLEEVAAGRAVARMRVRADMVNGFGVAHGGWLVVLADTAFAFACNTHGTVTVAAGADVAFLRPASEGDDLVAEAVERWRGGRTGLYDVTVRDAATGAAVLEFRGRSHDTGRPLPGSG